MEKQASFVTTCASKLLSPARNERLTCLRTKLPSAITPVQLHQCNYAVSFSQGSSAALDQATDLVQLTAFDVSKGTFEIVPVDKTACAFPRRVSESLDSEKNIAETPTQMSEPDRLIRAQPDDQLEPVRRKHANNRSPARDVLVQPRRRQPQ